MANRQLRVVKLLEPELCNDCFFARVAEVATQDGQSQRMVYCTRRDCDNWDFSDAEAPVDVHVLDEAA